MGNAVGGGSGGLGPVALTGPAATGDTIEATSATAAIWTAGGGGPPTGAAGGDLSGTYPDPAVVSSGGFNIESAAFFSASAFDAAGAAAAAAAASLPLTGGTMSGPIAMGSDKITGLTNGSGAQDAAAFGQLPTLASLGAAPLASPALTGSPTAPTQTAGDNSTKIATDAFVIAAVNAAVQGLAIKPSAQEATTTALPANTYSNGASGVGATLTAVLPGVLTVDGQVVALLDRILVQDEAAPANNGIYVATTLGSVSVAYILTRASDMNQAAEVPGAFVFVEQGTVNGGAGFTVASPGPFTIGTTAISWTQFSGAGEIVAGSGLAKSGNTLSIGASPALPGTPTAPTAAPLTDSTQIATTAYADLAVAAWGVLPAAAIAQTLPRQLGFAAYTITTATLNLAAIWLPAGVSIGHIAVVSSSTAANTPLNWWFGLWDVNLNQLAVTADQTTTPWAATTAMTLAIATVAAGSASSFMTTYAGLYYVGMAMKATTPVTLLRVGSGSNNAITAIAPSPGGGSTTGLTAPPAFPSTATAISSGNSFYAYVAA